MRCFNVCSVNRYTGPVSIPRVYQGYTRGIPRVFKGYTRDIQRVYKGIQGFIGFSQDIISSLT